MSPAGTRIRCSGDTVRSLSRQWGCMSVVLELEVAAEDFALGRALTVTGGRIELERIIPMESSLIPFFWVRGESHERLAESVGESAYIKNLQIVESVGDHTLYRVEWTGERDDLLEGLHQTGATILEAHSDGS